MAAPGALFGSLIGPNFMSVGGALLSGFTTYAMAAQKACIVRLLLLARFN